MKLPSINQKIEKPSSASSSRSQNQPPKSVTSNLEKNLFNKLQQYDDLHNIKTIKPVISLQAKEQEDISSSQKSKSSKIYQKKVEDQIQPKYRQSDTTIIQNKIRFADEVEVTNTFQQNLQKTIEKSERLRPILMNKQKQQPIEEKQVFITSAVQLATEPIVKNDIEDNYSQTSSEGDQIEAISMKQKERQNARNMLNNGEDEDLGQLNTLISHTNSEMGDFYTSMSVVKNTVTNMTENVKSLGIQIRPELLDQLNKQFQELLDIQRDDDAIEEFDFQKMKQRKQRGPQANKAVARGVSSSLQQKKTTKKKKSKNNDSFDRN